METPGKWELVEKSKSRTHQKESVKDQSTYILVGHHFFGRDGGVDPTDSALANTDVELETLESAEQPHGWDGQHAGDDHDYGHDQHPTRIRNFHGQALEKYTQN